MYLREDVIGAKRMERRMGMPQRGPLCGARYDERGEYEPIDCDQQGGEMMSCGRVSLFISLLRCFP